MAASAIVNVDMKLRDVTWLSARGLMARPLEAVLEVSAIAIGVALFSTSLSLIRYYANDIEAAAQDIRFRTARIAVYTRSEPASLDTALLFDVPVDKLNQPIPLSLLSTIRSECPIIRWVYADEEWGFNSGSLEIMTALSVRKVTADFFEAHRLQTSDGSIFTEADYRPGYAGAIIGAGLSRRLFPNGSAVGKRIDLGPSSSWTVIGVLAPHTERFAVRSTMGAIDEQLIVPLDSSAASVSLAFVVEDSSAIGEAIVQLQTCFETSLGLGHVGIDSERDWLKKERRIGLPLFQAISFITSAVLLVIIVNVLGLLLGRIERGRRGIGLAIAVGAARHDIVVQHLTGSLLTGIMGGFLGIGAASLLASAVQRSINPEDVALPGLRLALQPVTIAVSIFLVVAIDLVLVFFSARQASRVRAAEAFRME